MFKERIEHDFRANYQDLKCYECGANNSGEMIICINGKDPDREDEYGKDGYTACCVKEACQAKIGEGDPDFPGFKEIARKRIRIEKIVEAGVKYQILDCYECSNNTNGKMTVCINKKDPEIQD